MIKAVSLATLERRLKKRLAKLAEIEGEPDPGPTRPAERSNNLYLLAFRRGTVRQLCELILEAKGDRRFTAEDVKDIEAKYREKWRI